MANDPKALAVLVLATVCFQAHSHSPAYQSIMSRLHEIEARVGGWGPRVHSTPKQLSALAHADGTDGLRNQETRTISQPQPQHSELSAMRLEVGERMRRLELKLSAMLPDKRKTAMTQLLRDKKLDGLRCGYGYKVH